MSSGAFILRGASGRCQVEVGGRWKPPGTGTWLPLAYMHWMYAIS